MIIRGENFQSWKDFEIDASGLTVLVGPSDTGKSAIYRALRGVVRNEVDAGYLRTGAEELSVTIVQDGHTYKASRKGTDSTKYVIDGEPFKKGARTIPEPVENLRLGILSIGGVKLDPVFAGQHDSKFMLQGVSPSDMNVILGAFSSTEKLEHGKKQANLQVTQCNADARALAKEVNEAETRKDRIAGLLVTSDEVFQAVGLLEIQVRANESVLTLVRAGENQLRAIANLRKRQNFEVSDLTPLIVTFNTRNGLRRVAEQQAIVAFRQRTTLIPDPVELLEQAKVTYYQARALNNASLLLEKREQANLGQMAEQIERTEELLVRVAELRFALRSLVQLMELEKRVFHLHEQREELAQALSSCSSHIAEAQDGIAREAAAQAQAEREAQAITCPKCKHIFHQEDCEE